MIRSLLCAVAVAGSVASHAQADAADVADLFPAGTLAYAEVRNPGDAARVVAGWVRGTPFEDGLRLVQDRKDAVKDFRVIGGHVPVGAASLLVSPEFLREVGRFGGMAVGLTGFTDKHEPQVAAVVLFGDSAAAGLLARGWLTTGRDFRRVDTVEGVPILQHRAYPAPAVGNDGKPLPLDNPKPTEGRYEATYAYRPGVLVVGTSKAAVADVLRRHAGKAVRPSLPTDAAFRRFADDRKKPGVFFYAAPPSLAKALDAARKAGRDVIDADALAALTFVANPRALPAVGGNLALGDDEVTLSLRANVDPEHPSPLLRLLGGTAGSLPLAPTPAGTVGAVAFALPNPADRSAAVLAFADACAKATGELGPLPSERLAGAETRVGLRVRDDVLRRVSAVTVVVPPRQELPKGVPNLPILIVRTESPADAAAVAAVLPKVVRLLTGADATADPSSETVAGVRTFSLPTAAAIGIPAIHYAGSGPLVVIGLDRKLVADVAAGSGQGPARFQPAPDGEAVLGFVHLGPLARLATPLAPMPVLSTAAPNAPPPADRPDTNSTPPATGRAIAAALDTLPPLIVRVRVGGGAATATVSVRGFREKLPAFAEKLVLWLEAAGADIGSADGTIPRVQFEK